MSSSSLPRVVEDNAAAAAHGPGREGSSNGINFAVIMAYINFYMQNRCIQIVILWMTFILPRLRRVIANIIQEVSPTMGLAFIALCIQNINQVPFSQGNTLPQTSGQQIKWNTLPQTSSQQINGNTLPQTSGQQINGLAVVLLFYGLLTPNRAGGRLAMFTGVLLVVGSALAIAFR